VKLTITGAVSGEFTTDESGSATLSTLKDGTYRLRCEHEGFVTLEREFIVRAPQPASIDVTLNRAPPPPPPAPAPAPPPAQKPAPPPVPPSGPPVSISIPDYVDKNFVGRDPLKESVLACNGLETVRLLQLRDPLAEHTHSNMDEVLYVVAGEGTIHLGATQTNLGAGSLSVVPHGTPHSVERRGRNPLILLSTLTGAPCPNVR
jgi:mannose-6-phosphate isomerase-like protein (cupin superfamily)